MQNWMKEREEKQTIKATRSLTKAWKTTMSKIHFNLVS
jgi:hypothetical protein